MFRAPLKEPSELDEREDRPVPDAPSSRANGAEPEPPSDAPPKGGVLVVTAGQRLRKVLATELGRIDPSLQPWPEPLADVAERYRARWAVELKMGALDELMERFADRLRREQDALGQVVLLVGILRELEADGKIRVWPWRLSSWPVPHERVLTRAMDALCPDGKAMLLGVFQQGELYTALVARRRGSGFDLLLGPDRLRNEMGLVSGDWRRDYRHLVRAAEAHAAPLAIGCFGELDTLRNLLTSPSPGAWAAAVAARDVVLSPAVPAVAIPLGLDVGRAAIVAVRGLAERMGAGAWLSADGPLAPAFNRVREFAGVDKDVRHLLGFDPILLISKLFSRGEEQR